MTFQASCCSSLETVDASLAEGLLSSTTAAEEEEEAAAAAAAASLRGWIAFPAPSMAAINASTARLRFLDPSIVVCVCDNEMKREGAGKS